MTNEKSIRQKRGVALGQFVMKGSSSSLAPIAVFFETIRH